MYTVIIRGLEFYAYHGVPAEERVVGHRFKIDLDLDVEGDTDETDDIVGTVDYGAAAQLIMSVAQGHRYKTVEKLARVIGEKLLQEHLCIKSLEIALTKRLPPAPMIAEEVGVRIRLTR